jgi:hypothetical protein
VVVIDGREQQGGDFTLDVFALAESCTGRCGAPGERGACSCDAACVAAGDCCSDACTSCGHCRCQSSCAGAECGGDGCGGSCGECGAGEVCEAGRCVADRCEGVSCGACSACAQGRCQPLPEGAACEDEDACTVLDRCTDGRCRGETRVCDDGFACTFDECDEHSGACVFSPDPECCERDACGGDAGCGPADPRCPSGARDGGPPRPDGGAAPREGETDDGCGCRAAGGSAAGTASFGAAALWSCVLLGALGRSRLRRRRRRVR